MIEELTDRFRNPWPRDGKKVTVIWIEVRRWRKNSRAMERETPTDGIIADGFGDILAWFGAERQESAGQ